MKFINKILICFLLLAFIPKASAQELLPPSDEEFSEEFEEDDYFEEEEEEKEEEIEEEEEEEESYIDDGFETHLLRFDFRSKVEFFDQENGGATSGFPFLEIEYKTQFEATLDVTRKKQTLEIESIYSTENWGFLAKNEFFDCRLKIELNSLPVSINASRKKPKDEEESDTYNIGIKFDKNLDEDWFSFCTDISGSMLNTKGEKENYLFQVLKRIEPAINKLLIEDFVQEEYYEYDLKVDSTTINDDDISNDILLSGEGILAIEPL